MGTAKRWAIDMAERVVVTFLQAWLGAWIVLEDVTLSQLLDNTVLTIGVVAAVGSFLKALAASQIGREDSASLVE